MSDTSAPEQSKTGVSLKGLRAMGFTFDPLPRRLSTTNLDRLRRVERLTETLDTAYEVPGTKFRVGLDSLIGLLPVAGDSASALISCFIVLEARKMGLSRVALAKMLANIGVDAVVGCVPLVGDLFDVAYKANLRNLRIIKAELERMDQGQDSVDAES